jgi:histidine triad (HIT) family protein
MSAANSCVFCEIVSGTAPASVVYRDSLVCAFMDLHPINPGHLLVVSNRHAANLDALDPDVGQHMFRVAHRMASALRRSGIRCDGVNLFLADGVAAGQDVFHTHLHVLPRFEADGLEVLHSARAYAPTDRDTLDRLATLLRTNLAKVNAA